MHLHIDTTNNQRLLIKLDEQEKVIENDQPRKQDILLNIVNFLNEKKVTPQQLTAISVATGPGAFTSLRVGVTIANTMAAALNIPINKQQPGSVIIPEYGQEPRITVPKWAKQLDHEAKEKN